MNKTRGTVVSVGPASAPAIDPCPVYKWTCLYGALPTPPDGDSACVSFDLACGPKTSFGMSPGLRTWVSLDQAEADQDLEAAFALFADDAQVRDHAGRHATGSAQIRQWLELDALPQFREHVVGTLQVAVDRVTWVDRLANPDGSTHPVQVDAVLGDGKIRAFTSTDLTRPMRSPDLRVAVLLGLLVPVIGWLAWGVAFKWSVRHTDARVLGDNGRLGPVLSALRNSAERRVHRRVLPHRQR